jgi:hypothetical protein
VDRPKEVEKIGVKNRKNNNKQTNFENSINEYFVHNVMRECVLSFTFFIFKGPLIFDHCS